MQKSILIILISFFFISCEKNTLFHELGKSETNIDFSNELHESEEFNVLKYGYFYNGGGVASADFNNDGFLDLYFSGNLKPNKLYLNLGANKKLQFEDITETAGVAAADGWNTGVSVVDINSDGWMDIYVCRSAAQNPKLRKNLLFINDAYKTNKNQLVFTEKAAQYGLDNNGYSSQAAFFDYDKDGDLDAYILNHSIQEYAGFSRLLAANKQVVNTDFSSKLLRNDNGFYTDVSQTSGMISNVLSFGLGVSVSDFNADGWLDFYVSNDYNEEDYLYINQQNGTFKESIKEQTGHVSLFSMGNDVADINNDGFTDILTLDMLPESNQRIKMTSGDDNFDKYQMLLNSGFHDQSMRNMLHLNNGNGTFSEIGQLAGISNTDWSWSALMADYDLDGFKDIFITNGYAKDYTNMDFLKYSMEIQSESKENGKPINQLEVIKKIPSIDSPNYIYKNNGNLTFDNKQKEWGFSESMMSNGAVYADLDNDGDLDLVVNNINKSAKIFENTQTETKHNNYLKVKLIAKNPAFEIGAKVEIYIKGKKQIQEFLPVRGFQSSSYGALVFGLGNSAVIDSLQITWTDNSIEKLKNINSNIQIEVTYKENLPKKHLKSYYPENTTITVFNQPNTTINEFKIQPLLPKMQSNYGSRVTSGDINNDGKTDIFICGSGKNPSQLLLNLNDSFKAINSSLLVADAVYNDHAATFADIDNDNDLDLIVVSSGYDLVSTSDLLKPRIYYNDGKGGLSKVNILNFPINASCVLVADFDKDGKKDIFIGGASQTQNYPLNAQSLLLKNMGNNAFKPNTKFSFGAVGLVRDAQILDVNHDFYPDLVLAGDFQPIRLLKNNGGNGFTITEIAPAGMWNRLKVEDLDNDGNPDIIAGNEGLNTQLVKNTDDNGLKLLGGYFGNESQIVPIVAFSQQNIWYPYASRDEILDQIPNLKPKYTNYESYSNAVLGDIIDKTKIKVELQAKLFKTIILKNNNSNFIIQELPIEAQFSPVHAIGVFDYDNDGYKDIILAGNESKSRVRIGKTDANYLQVFKGEKTHTYTFLPNSTTKISVKGDVSDITVINQKLIIFKH